MVESSRFKIARIKVILETIKAIKAGKRFIVHQGGSRSGKTYSIIQLLIAVAIGAMNFFRVPVSISVCSIAMPHLRRGAIRDWREQMEKNGLYFEDAHQKTEGKYSFWNGNYMEFFSIDEPTKVRGPGRDILFINEANLVPFETFQQLNMRTKKLIILDYNPADEFHWIYDKILPREDCHFVQTTYKDNPYLPKAQREEIEKLKESGGNWWKVYGLGERGTAKGLIYPNHITHEGKWPEKVHGYGLDFGFSNDPTALVECYVSGNELFVKELIYETHLTNSDLIKKMKSLGINGQIWADSAEPQRIEEIRRAGFNIKPVKKGPESVKLGIDKESRHKILLHPSGINTQKEIKSYKWQTDKNDIQLAKPIEINDHAMDAIRYFVQMQSKQKNSVGLRWA